MNRYKVCIAQTTSYKDGKEYNLQRAGEMIREAAANGAALIVFPEMYLTGYRASHMVHDLCEPADGPSSDVMAWYAADNNIFVAYGFPELRINDNDGSPQTFNSVNLISNKGELIGTYAKTHLFGDEKINFTPGTEKDFKVYDTELGKVGMLICYDLEFPEPARRLGARGADVIIAISANMGPYEDLHKHFATSRAMENCAFVVYCNYSGSDDRFTYVGRSGLYEPDGNIQTAHDARFEGLIYAELDLGKTRPEDENVDYLRFISDDERTFYLR